MDFLYVSIVLVCFLFTWGGLYLLIPLLIKNQFIDIPNSRSSHTKHTPRGGGMALILGVLLGSFLCQLTGYPMPDISLYLAVSIVFITSFLDDKRSLPVFTRLVLHSLAAGIVIYATGGLKFFPIPFWGIIHLGFWSIPLSYIWILAVLNIYNFLDGIDGFSGSQAVIASLAMSVMDWGGMGMYVGFLVASAALAFLMFNWHPAKVFMGDVGSITLGFLFASLPFYSLSIPSERGVFAIAIFLWFFLSDGVFTIMRRLMNGEKIWQAHRSHLFQRLIKTGLRHDQVTFIVMVPAAILALLEVLVFKYLYQYQLVVFLSAITFFGFYVLLVFLRERKQKV